MLRGIECEKPYAEKEYEQYLITDINNFKMQKLYRTVLNLKLVNNVRVSRNVTGRLLTNTNDININIQFAI